MGIPRVDDRDFRVISGIIFVIKNGLRWRGCAEGLWPVHKTIYNRFIRWSELGVFNRIFAELAGKVQKPDRLDDRRDAPQRPHRTAASLLKKGLFPGRIGRTKEAA